MPQKVIGLDIGLRSIKAVQLTSTLRGFELTHFARLDLPPSEGGNGLKERSQLVERFLKEQGFSGDTIVSSLPGSRTMVHYLELPFSDPKKVRQVVKFELEPYLPIPIDEVVVDCQILENAEGEKTRVLTAAAKKTTMEEYLLALKGAGIDPRIVDVEPFAAYNCLIHYNQDDLTGVVLFLDIGSDHTSMMVLVDGLPKACRIISYGGDAMSSALAAALALSPREAEELKRTTPLPLEAPAEGASNALAEAFDGLVREIQITLHTGEFPIKDSESAKIILTGGGSRIENIQEYLSRALGMQARHFEPLSGCFHGLGALDPGEQHHMAAGLGLALRGINRGVVQTNLRQEEFSILHRLQEIRGKLAFLGAALMVLLALGIGDMLVSLHIKESHHLDLKKQITQTFKETFPDVKAIVEPLSQTRMRIKEEKSRVGLLGGFQGQGSMLGILEAVHKVIAKELHVRITDFNVDEKLVFIAGEAGSYDVVDKIKTSLSTIPLFQDGKIESATMSKVAGVVEFKFKAQRR